MDQQLQALEQALRKDQVDNALEIARQLTAAGGDPKQRAIDIAKAAGTAYRAMVSRPVEEFIDQCPRVLPSDISPTVSKAVGRLISITRDWEGRVRACYEERLARELRDFVRSKEFSPAIENVGRLVQPGERMTEGERDEDIQRRAIYVGNVLGTCLNHPREADHLLQLIWKKPEAMGLTQQIVQEMKAAKDERHGQMMTANVENIEAQWTGTLRETQTEILNMMPPRNQSGEPSDEELRDIGDVFRSVLRVPLELKQYRILIDSTLILVDFLPKQTAAAAKSSGVEGRSYEQLGFRARKAVALVLRDIGKIGHFARFYMEFAKRSMSTPYLEEMVELMGAFRTPHYEDFFVELWEAKEHRSLRGQLSVAMGNLASPKAADFMLDELDEVFSKRAAGIGEQLKRLNEWKVSDKAIDPVTVRRAERILQGLGRIIRSPRADDKLRKRIFDKVIATVPQDERRLGQAIAIQIMAPRPENLNASQRKWAIEKLTDAMWVQDQSTEMHRGGERQTTILGGREELANALKRLGEHDPDTLLRVFDEQSPRYSGAYIAAGHVLEDIPHPQAVAVLNKMLMNAATHNESRQSAYQQETYWDATDQQRKPLTRDRVMAELVDALGSNGSREAVESLEEISRRIQMGNIRHPGPETITAITRYLKIPEQEAASEQAANEAPRAAPHPALASQEGEGGHTPRAVATDSMIEADPKEVKQLVKTLSSSFVLASARKRTEKKIQALVRLGQLTPPSALKALFDNLTDKDNMIVSATLTTLSEYAAPNKPHSLTYAMLDELEEALTVRDHLKRQAAAKLLREIGPNREHIKKRLAEMARRVDRTDSRQALEEAIGQKARIKPLPTGQTPETAGTGVKQSAAVPDNVRALELKREYMAARKRWINGGKQGDPPAPPPGV